MSSTESAAPEGAALEAASPRVAAASGQGVSGATIAAVAGTMVVLAGWDFYLLSDHPARMLLFLLLTAALGGLALWWDRRRVAPRRLAGWWRQARGRPRLVAVWLAVLTGGLVYRLLLWPKLEFAGDDWARRLFAGDSHDYDGGAAASVLLHHYVLVPWRTPGYTFTLFWIYGWAGALRYDMVHLLQIALSLATAVLMAAAAHLITGRHLAAVIALAIGCFLYPVAVASAVLMTEQQAMFLATLAGLLVLVLHRGRGAGAAALLLGPTLGLLYETRPPMLAWALVAGALALLAVRSRFRWGLVIVLGTVLTLLPVTIVNLQSPARAATPGAVLDLVPQALGTDRFSIYWNVPASPAAMEAFHEAIVTDGAAAEYWSGWPATTAVTIMAERRSVMVQYILAHPSEYLELYLRRAPLMFRYDQQWDLTYDRALPGAWLVAVDVLLALAAVGLVWMLRHRLWLPAALLGGLLLSHVLSQPLIHVEPRYSLPALPAAAVLTAVGSSTVLRSLREAAGGRAPRRLAAPAAAIAAVALSAVAAEAWLWPGLVATHARAPGAADYRIVSCSPGPHMLAAVAWQPGTSRVLAGGMNGIASWDLGRGTCAWTELLAYDIWDLSFTRDGARVAIGAYQAGVMDSRTLQPVPRPASVSYLTGAGADVLGVSFDPSGRWLAYAAPAFDFVGVFDTVTNEVDASVSPAGRPISVRWSPDGSLIAVGAADGHVSLYDAALRPVQDLRLDRGVEALAWSPAGDRLAAGDDAGTIHVWSVGARSLAGPPAADSAVTRGHRGAVRSLAFSPDGTRLASGSSDRTAAIWSASDLQPTRRLAGDTAPVWAVAWSPDGSRVVTAAADCTLALWSAA